MRKKLATKICAIVMTAAMVASMAGCGNDAEQNPSGSGSTPTSENKESNQPSDESQGGSDETPDEGDGEEVYVPFEFPTYDLGGVELKVLAHNNFADLNPDAEGLEPDKAAERKAKKEAIEAKYNVKLTFVSSPTDSWDDIQNEVVKAYIAEDPVADVMSAYYTFVGTYYNNDILYDFSADFANSDIFTDKSKLGFGGKMLGITKGMGGEGLYYNADMIRDMGMEHTPAEMFDMGMWSYTDMLAYLRDMRTKMSEDEYPLFVDPLYWALFATPGNGVSILDPSGNLNYCSDAMLECMEFYKTTCDENLTAIPRVTLEDGSVDYDTWNYPGQTFDQGQTVAIAHRAAWQAAGCPDKFDLEFVPYPWGSNVTIDESKKGQPGAYKTLSDNYGAAYYDGKLTCLIKGIEKKADPMQVMSMLCEWQGWDDSMVGYVEPPKTGTDNYPGWLEDGSLAKELYYFSTSKEKLQLYHVIRGGQGFKMYGYMYNAAYEGESVRSLMESAYNQDMSKMVELGFADESVFKPFDIPEEEGSEE